jgi:hypothetical protein
MAVPARVSPFYPKFWGLIAMRELLQLTPVYEQVEGGWTQAGLLELPGVITAAPSREEAQDMLVDALREFLLSFSDGVTPATAAASPEGLTLTVQFGPASLLSEPGRRAAVIDFSPLRGSL